MSVQSLACIRGTKLSLSGAMFTLVMSGRDSAHFFLDPEEKGPFFPLQVRSTPHVLCVTLSPAFSIHSSIVL